MVDKLEACPFCGGEAQRYTVMREFENRQVCCKSCGASAFDLKWNRRTTPTEDARERVKVLEEALEPFAALAGTFDAVSRRYLGVGIDGHLGSTSLPVGGDEARKTCGITVDDLILARTALGNKETDRHG